MKILNYDNVLNELYSYLLKIGIIFEDFTECNCAFENIQEYLVEGIDNSSIRVIMDEDFSYQWNITKGTETLYNDLKSMF